LNSPARHSSYRENELSYSLRTTHTFGIGMRSAAEKYIKAQKTNKHAHHTTMDKKNTNNKRPNDDSDAEPCPKRAVTPTPEFMDQGKDYSDSDSDSDDTKPVRVHTVHGTAIPGFRKKSDNPEWQYCGWFSSSDVAESETPLYGSHDVVTIYIGRSRHTALFKFLRALAYFTTGDKYKREDITQTRTRPALRAILAKPAEHDNEDYAKIVKSIIEALGAKMDNAATYAVCAKLQENLALLRGENTHISLVYNNTLV
jgi:hypothetical protein